MIEATIHSSIVVERAALSEEFFAGVTSDLTVPNADKQRAVDESIRGAGLIPDFLELWSERGGKVTIPRGYAHRFEQIAVQLGEEVCWNAEMTLLPASQHPFRGWIPSELRGYQVPARDAMLDWAQGIFQAPTGSGKTRTSLEAIRWAGQRTLVIVGKTSLARQWQEAVLEIYDYETGYIGEGVFDDKPDLAIAIWQTLWARKDEIPPEFWRNWGMIVGDEVHHAGAQSLYELMGRFPAFYRLGVSATPNWDESSWPFVKALFGPVIHETTEEDVGDSLMTPSIELIDSGFEAEYIPTHYEENEYGGRRRIQNNFTEIMGELVRYAPRNEMIADLASNLRDVGHHVLIVTRRIEHVELLYDLLDLDGLYVLTGAQTGKQAQEIAHAIAEAGEGTILISTVADEALDIPRLDRLIMAFPIRKTPLIQQQLGRIRRKSPGKTDAIVYDICDDGVGPLTGQRAQREKFYVKRGWPMQYINREEINA